MQPCISFFQKIRHPIGLLSVNWPFLWSSWMLSFEFIDLGNDIYQSGPVAISHDVDWKWARWCHICSIWLPLSRVIVLFSVIDSTAPFAKLLLFIHTMGHHNNQSWHVEQLVRNLNQIKDEFLPFLQQNFHKISIFVQILPLLICLKWHTWKWWVDVF